MPVPINKALYQRVKNKSNRIFSKSSLVRSKWIVNEYVKEGGRYRGKRSDSTLSKGFRKWNSKHKKDKRSKTNRSRK
jgi:hypothetical protein